MTFNQWTNGPIVQWTNGPTDQWTALTSAATTTPAFFSDERLARLEALQIASEVLSIRMKQQEAALAQGGMLPR